ncbi:gluconate periplasmic binding protein [Escherichia coli]|uniref:Gluconate periplasmic binding protein n=1 Tax=Escherichia coli TaxID=562 RepID=A0A2X1P028_ECOLX|nr:gluconate periplasmic binding protein [Escherichia coli]
MPNATGVRSLGGFVRSVHAPPAQIKRYAHNVDYPPHTPIFPAVAACKNRRPGKDWSRLPDYAPPLSPLIHQLKFSRRSEIASALSRLLLLEVLHARRTTGLQLPDRIVQRSVWQRRHWRRGFNQSDLLCQPLSRWLHCQWDSEAVTRTRATATPAFSQCPAAQAQPEKCLRLELPVQGRHMVIVDDVVTTGSTVAEIAQLLLRNGAAAVQVWCLCRTL